MTRQDSKKAWENARKWWFAVLFWPDLLHFTAFISQKQIWISGNSMCRWQQLWGRIEILSNLQIWLLARLRPLRMGKPRNIEGADDPGILMLSKSVWSFGCCNLACVEIEEDTFDKMWPGNSSLQASPFSLTKQLCPRHEGAVANYMGKNESWDKVGVSESKFWPSCLLITF